MDRPQEVTDDDALRQLHEKGLGFIYNDFSGLGATGNLYNVLHAARCPWVPRSNTKVHKFFFPTLDAARAWLTSERGEEDVRWKRCRTCGASVPIGTNESSGAPSSVMEVQRRSRAPVEKRSEEPFVPFKEERVEKCLVSWFEAQGFRIDMRVVVASGIIDFVARRGTEVWVIEAKGEDRGGYNSAEMNFRIGIGQISSRMVGFENACFGVAIPLTRDFKRVLRKFEGSIAFEKLGLWLFAVDQTEQVTRVAPEGARSFIGALKAPSKD
jgi:hypothetical protein